MLGKRLAIELAVFTVFTMASLVTSSRAVAQQETVLHSFDGNDGAGSASSLIFDAAGNLYGTTVNGGAYKRGTAFELTPAAGGWTEKVLHSFNDKDGQSPGAGLIFDAAGNLYGTTTNGGAYGYGTAFELIPAAGGRWTEKVLHSFNNNGKDGYGPGGSLILDATGNLYGTTSFGGPHNSGIVFELMPKSGGWAEKPLHAFQDNGKDGYYPFSGLIFDTAGDLYGTTNSGGAYGYGTAFELVPIAGGRWTESIPHSFNINTDGCCLTSNLIFNASGSLYGTAMRGAYGYGTVFELTPAGGGSWSETTLYNFNIGTDGRNPLGGVIFDVAGNLYGTTADGGTGSCSASGAFGGCGTVFELTPTTGGSWTEKVLYSFKGDGTDGIIPPAGLTFDATGNLYGTTELGGAYGDGAVFEITP
jgi:uncharacterized repeat protein (TIGR03803 family)